MLRARHDRHMYWRAIWEGRSNDAAAEAAGVTRAGARNWFRKAGGVTPAHLLLAPSGRYLSPMDRAAIMVAHRQGQTVRDIAAMLGRAPSTISRELRRNRRHWMPQYHAAQAQLMAEGRTRRPQRTKLETRPDLREYVQQGLERRWSPQQISHRLRVEHPSDESMRISHESIYRAIYAEHDGALKRDLVPRLRTGRALRRPRRQARQNAFVFRGIPDPLSIRDRPRSVEDRRVPGHWEGDLIVGPRSGSHIGTLVERSSRFTVLVHLPTTKNAGDFAASVVNALRDLPPHLRRSLTWDRGTEMRYHREISAGIQAPIYFCDPRSPWQRGTNENTNGLLRQYFPKSSDLSRHSLQDLDYVAHELNHRPRRVLQWRTPAEVFAQFQQPGYPADPSSRVDRRSPTEETS